MGKLVQFDPRRRDARPRPPKEAPAEILIFTGVRYERAEATEPDKPTSAPTSRPKRKRG